MNQEPFIGVYWAARKETHRECVIRTLEFLKAISKEPNLTDWFRGGTRTKAGTPQELNMAAIGQRMTPGMKKCRGIPDPDLTDELGFSFGAWNGNHKAAASILVTCGLQDPHQSNAVALDLFCQPFPGDQESQDRFKRLLNIAVRVWDPDLVVVTTSERKDLAFGNKNCLTQDEWEKCMTSAAWLLYRKGQPLFIDPSV